MKKWVNKASSFKDAAEFDKNYYLAMSGTERLEIVQFLRGTYSKMKRGSKSESRKGLRRSVKIVQ